MKNYAGFWRRFAAAFIDGIVTGGVSMMAGDNNVAATLTIILSLAYATWMIGMYQATIGGMVMGIKVIKENGKRIDYPDALVRELASYLSAVVFFLGFFWMIWDSKKQTWHDKIAKTIVVKN